MRAISRKSRGLKITAIKDSDALRFLAGLCRNAGINHLYK
jgi:hypothetical protein